MPQLRRCRARTTSGQTRRDGRRGAAFPWMTRLPELASATRSARRSGAAGRHHPKPTTVGEFPQRQLLMRCNHIFAIDDRSGHGCSFLFSWIPEARPLLCAEGLAVDPISDEHVACQLCSTATKSILRQRVAPGRSRKTARPCLIRRSIVDSHRVVGGSIR